MEIEKYKIVDSQGNVMICDISESFYKFINDVDDMKQLYSVGKYTQAEEIRDKIAEKLDDVMYGYYHTT